MEQEPDASAQTGMATEEEGLQFQDLVLGVVGLFEDALEEEDRDGSADLPRLWTALKALLGAGEAEEPPSTYAAAGGGAAAKPHSRTRPWYQVLKRSGRTGPVCYVEVTASSMNVAKLLGHTCAIHLSLEPDGHPNNKKPADPGIKKCGRRCPPPPRRHH